MSNQSEEAGPDTRWQKVRAKGKRDYVLKMALLVAVFNFAFSLLSRILWPSKSAPQDAFEQTLGYAGFQAFCGFLTGLVVGAWTWRTNEKRYNKTLKHDGLDKRPEMPS
jgi:membrane associated rhomboid family serine protease